MFNLGTVYYNGDGVGIDDVASYAWFLLSQSFGNEYAADAVKRMKEEKGNLGPEALEKIGDMYQRGDDLPQNSSEAIKWYRKAAENGGEAMQVKLASLLLLKGQSGPSNYAEVLGLCEKAAARHYAAGAACMGELYLGGLGVDQSFPTAAKWFVEAANSGNALALLRLGQMHLKGEGLKQDKTSAYEFIYLAGTSDLPEAKQEKERLEKELTPKELGKAKAKAVEWARQHPPLALQRHSAQ
jgi:TPR repeat protein